MINNHVNANELDERSARALPINVSDYICEAFATLVAPLNDHPATRGTVMSLGSFDKYQGDVWRYVVLTHQGRTTMLTKQARATPTLTGGSAAFTMCLLLTYPSDITQRHSSHARENQ